MKRVARRLQQIVSIVCVGLVASTLFLMPLSGPWFRNEAQAGVVPIDNLQASVLELLKTVADITSNDAFAILLQSKPALKQLVADTNDVANSGQRFIEAGNRLVQNAGSAPQTISNLFTETLNTLNSVSVKGAELSVVISNGTVDFATIGLVGELSVDVTKLMEQVGKIQQFINDFDVLLDSGKRISDAVQRTFAAGNLQQIQTESGQALEAFVTFLQQEVQKLDQLQAFIANKIFESVLPLVPTLLDGGVKLGVYTAALGTYSTLCSLATDKSQCNADH